VERGRLAVLLGSGISCPAGLPGLAQITCQVLSGQDYVRHTTGQYVPAPQSLLGRREVECVCRLLGAIKRDVERDVRGWPARDRRPVNYEDLYFAARQIHEDLDGVRENPLVHRFATIHERRIRDLYRSCTSFNPEGPWHIWREVEHYVHDVVAAMLQQLPSQPTDYMRVLVEAVRDPDYAAVDLYTLNHDLLLEDALRAAAVEYVDGFGPPNGDGMRRWSPNTYCGNGASIRVLKLHGSVNWWLENDRPVITGPRRADRRWGWWPLMLIGTHDKAVRYTAGAFADLFCLFRQSLKKAQAVLVCGYGFGDVGINTQLTDWLSEDDTRTLLVVDPCQDLHRHVSPSIQREWQNGRVSQLVRPIQDTTWREVHASLRGT
jgi:hypothetical protein